MTYMYMLLARLSNARLFISQIFLYDVLLLHFFNFVYKGW